MKIAGLISGGKDSVYSVCKLIDEGHELVCIIHLYSTEIYSDSYMYQTVGSDIAKMMGECFGVPIIFYPTKCIVKNCNLNYKETENDEIEDLLGAVKLALKEHNFEGISSGAILSNYQKNRVEYVCNKLNIKSLTPLWQKDQKTLLKEMIDYGIEAKIVKIASPCFTKNNLNMSLSEIYNYLNNLNYKYEIFYCGEGGEYETIVINCKYFKKKIHFESIAKPHPDENGKNTVFYLEFSKIFLKNKI